jgi:hypothetical protein
VLRISIITLSLAISIVNTIELTSNATTKGIQLFTLIISVVILGFTPIQQLTKSQEDWIPFRATAERLKSEYQLFMHNAKPYSDVSINDEASKARLFVQRVENIYLTEGSEFTSEYKQLMDKSSINTATNNS